MRAGYAGGAGGAGGVNVFMEWPFVVVVVDMTVD